MATYTTYEVIGQAEDVSDVISNIAPTKTPFQSMIGSEKVDARLFEWQEDTLRAVAVNAKVEGADATDTDRVPTSMKSNYTQILSESFKISRSADRVKKYGRAKETAYQTAKTGEELKRDLEHQMVGVDQAAVAGTSSTARKMQSALNSIHANTTTVTDSNTSTAGNQAGPITEANVLSTHQKCYNEGAEPSVLMIKPADSLIVNTFAAASGRTRDFSDGKKIVNVVDLYVSPFGELKVSLNRFLKTTHAVLIDPEMWSKCVLDNWQKTPLAKVGDADRYMIVGEFSLKNKNSKGNGLITNLT